MARIRTIKPEFFSSFDVASVTPLSRLFFAYLWTESDKEGFLEWKPKNFRMRFFATDDYSIENIALELTAQGLIQILDGDICHIPGFKKHQVINNREAESTIISRVKVACTRVKAEGKEGKGKEGKDDAFAFEGETIRVTERDFQTLSATYPNIDIAYQLQQLDLELKGKKNWFMEMNSKLNYRNKTPAHHKKSATAEHRGLEI